MKYLVNGKEFDDMEEARSYELELEQKSKERNKVLTEAIEKNVHIVKVRDNTTNTIEYIAVGVDSEGVASGDSSFPKNIAFAYLEQYKGRRYSCIRNSKYVNVKEHWNFEKITNDELNSVRVCIYNHLNGGERHFGGTVKLGNDNQIMFLDYLYNIDSVESPKQNDYQIPTSFGEFLDSLAKGNVPTGFIRMF